MPRPTLRTLAPACVVLALIATVPPVSLAGALAAAAGTVFEALPFVVGAALLPRARVLKFLPSLACGCGGVLPAALALPALALTWISFGPVVAVARAGAALIVVFARHRGPTVARPAVERDPLAELTTLAVASGSASLVAELIRAHVVLAHGVAGAVASLLLGAFAGIVAPCATAGVGAAMALRAADPWAAFGLLATSGFFSLRRSCPEAPHVRDARFAFASLAFACLILWARGTHGFLNPRFAFVLPTGALAASIAAFRRTPTRSAAFAAPAMMLGSLVLGSPPPLDSTATVPLDLYPGRSVEFVGRVVRSDPTSTTLGRAAILCCRADAQQLSLTLDRRLEARVGAWIEVRGVALERTRDIVLRADSARVVTSPADPYLYL